MGYGSLSVQTWGISQNLPIIYIYIGIEKGIEKQGYCSKLCDLFVFTIIYSVKFVV